MTSQVFADGVSRIRVVNGTVRMEFVSSAEGAAGKTVLEPQVRVVMSVKGFAAAYRTMQQAMAALIRDGAVVTPAGVTPAGVTPTVVTPAGVTPAVVTPADVTRSALGAKGGVGRARAAGRAAARKG
jgi:hypothetical protein